MTAESGQQRVRALLSRLGVSRPRPLPANRTLALTAALVLVGSVLMPTALDPAGPHPADGVILLWWQLAAVFATTAVFVFHVEINREAHTFSLSEVPIVLGLFFAQPRDLVLGRLVGEAVVLVLVERQTLTKLLFNLGLFFGESMTALAIFRSLGGGLDPIDPRAWVFALAAVGCASTLSAVAVWGVIRLHGGQVSPRQLLVAAAVTVTGNTSLAALAAVLLREDVLALVPLLVVAGVLVAAYRGYSRLTKRYDGLEMLYQFTRISSGPQRPEETMQRVLEEAGRLLRTERALIALYAAGQDEPWLLLEATVAADGTAGGTVRRQDGDNLPRLIRQEVLRERRLLLVPRTGAPPDQREALAELGARDCLAAPLVSGGEASGVMLVCDRLGDVSTFDPEDGRLFVTLASQAAIALENGRLIERLHEQVRAREHEALHDALTGLPNRTLFNERLAAALAGGSRLGAVLLMDLDGFKEVNDTLGHHMGDELLRVVALRLRETVGDAGSVARLGGDEFVVMLSDVVDVAGALTLAGQLTEALRRPVALATMTVQVGVSIGIAVWPHHGRDPAMLLQRADVAMYTAKRTRSGVNLYDPDTDWNSQLRLRLAGELRAALDDHQLDVWYQPIARAAGGRVIGAEALVRWQHPEMGRLSPAEFIPLAERTGLIHELTLYVLDRALSQTAAWQAGGLDLFVTVNLPPQVLRDVDWAARVADRLATHGVAPAHLTFEITEGGIMTDPERMIRVLGALADTGVGFAIDDFGTGYSSLAYLQQLPVSKVKIDKSFVTPMVSDAGAATIVRSVVELARSLGLTAVAEGVEDQRTLDELIAMDCPLVQGYYLSRPIPAADLTAWMIRRRAVQDRPVHAGT